MGLLSEGQVIRGTYEVERFLGEGAFAEVYRVKHRFLGRQAMKVFKMTGMTVEETEEVLAEAILLSRLGHPNIVRVFDANVTETSRGVCGFFTMEYVAGGSLEQFWRSHGARLVPVETAVEILRQCCRGLAIAHGESPPVIHRDIKPQNILVGYDASGLRVRVSDFGLAKRVNPLTLMASAGHRTGSGARQASRGRRPDGGILQSLARAPGGVRVLDQAVAKRDCRMKRVPMPLAGIQGFVRYKRMRCRDHVARPDPARQ
jgi:serine/threonine protein kinase